MSKILCIYHGGCNDGFGAACVVRLYFGEENVEFYPAAYHQEPPDVTGRQVLIVDFSYKRPVLEAMAKVAHGIAIIDHHQTAIEDLAMFESLTHAGALPDLPKSGVRAYFDVNHSGAILTWNYFFPGRNPPPLLLHIEDRDIRFPTMSETSRFIGTALYSHEQSFSLWERMMDQVGCDILEEEGETLARAKAKDVTSAIKTYGRRMFILGHNVPVCNAPHMFSSDVGHELGKGEPFAATYCDLPDGRKFELRSAEGALDVSAIAKRYGGGGHKNAAGFTVQFCQADHHNVFPIKVFMVVDSNNMCRWYAAATQGDVWDCLVEDASAVISELTEGDLDTHIVTDKDGTTRTYRDELMRRIASGDKFPQPFAEPLS